VKAPVFVLVIALITLQAVGFPQKVEVGYDKDTDFSKYKTYSWAEPSMPPVWPVVFEAVVARVDAELQDRGLIRTPKDGDLTLLPSGGVGFGLAAQAGTPYSPTYGGPPPVMNATMWTGTTGPSTAGTYVSDGTFALAVVERATNKLVWSGSVKQSLDIQKKHKSLELVDRAMIKLMKQFPAKK
jgi:hypothetical protein